MTQLEKGMIYELRIYHSMPGRLPALLARFQNHTLRIWEKHGIRQAGFWTTLIGQSNQRLTYMLAWDSMAEREERWGAFLADPEWIAISTETEKDGQLVQNISSELLAPTAFSGREVSGEASDGTRTYTIRQCRLLTVTTEQYGQTTRNPSEFSISL